MRLTDQALVAVALARDAAAASGRWATVADLLAGLAAEPEGRAGRRLRARATAAAALAERAGSAPAPALDAVLRDAADKAAPRPAGTGDLLDAALTVGGPDVADLLVAAGYDRDLDPAGVAPWDPDAETYGLAVMDDPGMSRCAARIVAQVRAGAGGAVAVILAVAAAPDADGAALLEDPDRLALALSRLRERHPAAGTPGWDAGLDAVVTAAARLRGDKRTTTADLVRAAVVAGGSGPVAVLEEAQRL